jgi:MATE family, multidrug efflux pump
MLILAIPVLCEQFLNSFVGVTDVYLAGHVGEHATAAIGLAAYVSWLMTMLFTFVGTGTTALVSRFTGAGETGKANHYANQSLLLACVMGLAGTASIYFMAPVFASIQNMQGERFDSVVRYLRIEGSTHLFTSLTLVGAAALRGVGDMRTPLKILGIVNVVNMLVSCTLVFGLFGFSKAGIDGIVFGTIIGRVVGGGFMILTFVKGKSGLHLTKSDLVVRMKSARRLIRIGGPAAVDGIVMWTGHFVYLRIIATLAKGDLGNAYYDIHIIAVRLEALTYLPAVAYAAATATIVGQALGSGDVARARKAGHEAVIQCGLLAVGLTAFYYFSADWVFRVMHQSELVHTEGPPAMRMLAFFQVFLATSIVYVGALRGAGDTRYPLLITLVSVLLVRLPLGYFFGIVMGYGLIGAWIGMCGDMVVRAALSAWRFSNGRWSRAVV